MEQLPLATATFIKSLLRKVNRILDTLEALIAAPPQPTNWPEWMQRITALLAHYESTMRDLRPALQECLLVPAGGGLENVPNIMLRTKLAPEVEAHLNRLVGGNSSSATVFKALGQIMQETADTLKAFTSKKSTSTATPLATQMEDNRLVQAVQQLYTLQA